jgi:hypothetical protein
MFGTGLVGVERLSDDDAGTLGGLVWALEFWFGVAILVGQAELVATVTCRGATMTFIMKEPMRRGFCIPHKDEEAHQRANLLRLALVQLLTTSSHKIMLAKSPEPR